MTKNEVIQILAPMTVANPDPSRPPARPLARLPTRQAETINENAEVKTKTKQNKIHPNNIKQI